MIRGASLLKDSDSSGNPEVDELRAELIKQKILFEAELRRQREISDDRFQTMQRQLQLVVDDNAQLRNTLLALGERMALVENRGRSASPAPPPQLNADGTAVMGPSSSSTSAIPVSHRAAPMTRPQLNSSSAAGAGERSGLFKRHASGGSRHGSTGSRQTSPVPRVAIPQPQQQPQHHHHHPSMQNAQFVRIRASPSTTPRTTPRGPITRTASAGSVGGNSSVNGQQQQQQHIGATSPAHIPFRPVLRSQPFRSPLRQQQLSQMGKPVVNSGHWR